MRFAKFFLTVVNKLVSNHNFMSDLAETPLYLLCEAILSKLL